MSVVEQTREKTPLNEFESVVNGDDSYENVKGIWTWDKLRPPLPIAYQNVVVGHQSIQVC